MASNRTISNGTIADTAVGGGGHSSGLPYCDELDEETDDHVQGATTTNTTDNTTTTTTTDREGTADETVYCEAPPPPPAVERVERSKSMCAGKSSISFFTDADAASKPAGVVHSNTISFPELPSKPGSRRWRTRCGGWPPRTKRRPTRALR